MGIIIVQAVHELATMFRGPSLNGAAPNLLHAICVFSLGFRGTDGGGSCTGPAANLPPPCPTRKIPLLADAPGIPVAFGNSANHSGARGSEGMSFSPTVTSAFQDAPHPRGLPGDTSYPEPVNQSRPPGSGIRTIGSLYGDGVSGGRR